MSHRNQRANTPYGRKLYEVLSDGEWHLGISVVEQIAMHVPYGQAVRITKAHGKGKSLDEFGTGSRRLARWTINKAVQRGRVQKRGEGSKREYRLMPDEKEDSYFER